MRSDHRPSRSVAAAALTCALRGRCCGRSDAAGAASVRDDCTALNLCTVTGGVADSRYPDPCVIVASSR